MLFDIEFHKNNIAKYNVIPIELSAVHLNETYLHNKQSEVTQYRNYVEIKINN